MSNRTHKAKTLTEMVNLMNALECKLAVLAVLDRDVTAEDCMDLHDQVASMTHSLHRLTEAVMRANAVNGVDAEYEKRIEELKKRDPFIYK